LWPCPAPPTPPQPDPPPQPDSPPPKDLRRGGAYDRLLARLAAEDKFSGTVLLAHRGRPVLARSYGMANKDQSIPNGQDTLFNLPLITKSFTAVAIAQLAQQGKVGFHETLGAYLNGFSAEVANTAIVTRVSGQSYFDYVRQHVFRKAGLTRSGFLSRPQVLAVGGANGAGEPHPLRRLSAPPRHRQPAAYPRALGEWPGAATRLDVFPDLDWVSVILSNYDTTINPLVELERELITA
jgi:CubicO group peptidase (beta-lactamase class C family)